MLHDKIVTWYRVINYCDHLVFLEAKLHRDCDLIISNEFRKRIVCNLLDRRQMYSILLFYPVEILILKLSYKNTNQIIKMFPHAICININKNLFPKIFYVPNTAIFVILPKIKPTRLIRRIPTNFNHAQISLSSQNALFFPKISRPPPNAHPPILPRSINIR